MFFEHDDVVPVPVAAAQQRIETCLRGDDLTTDGGQAFRAGESVLLRAGFGPLSKRVAVDTLPATVHDDAIVISVRWIATGPAGEFFPALDGQIELAPVEPESTRITFRGSYRPPMGEVGAALDRALLGRAARATARTFVESLRQRVLEPQPGTEPNESAGWSWLAEEN